MLLWHTISTSFLYSYLLNEIFTNRSRRLKPANTGNRKEKDTKNTVNLKKVKKHK
jgi:hypothetical protein